jgi:hypothetical protein
MREILKRLNLLPCILSLMVLGVYAQPHQNAGKYPFDFINVNPDAYSTAMGGSSVSLSDGANGFFHNPAILSDHSSPGIFLGYAPVISDVNILSFAVSNSFKNRGVIAFSIVNFSSGDIPVIENNGGVPLFTNEVAGARGNAAALTWSYRFADYFSAGITLRGLYEKLSAGEDGEEFHSNAVAIDAGVHYNFLRNRFCVGGVIKNVGYIIHQYENYDRSLPSAVEIGVSYIPQYMKNIKLSCDASKMVGDFVNMRAGLEIFVYKEYLAIRAGLPFSFEDLTNLGKQDFVKTNNNSLAFGVGVNPVLSKVKTKFNFALQLKTQGVPPVFLVSNTTEF